MGEQQDEDRAGIKKEYTYRWAREEEWRPAITLIWKVFMESEGKEYTQQGIRNFFEFISDDDIYKAFLNGTYLMMVAEDAGRIIGAGTVRNRSRLSLLFVDEEYQKQGVGRALLEHLGRFLKEELGEPVMTVKAAPMAVEFYRKCGFQEYEPEQDYSGIRVIGMEKVL